MLFLVTSRFRGLLGLSVLILAPGTWVLAEPGRAARQRVRCRDLVTAVQPWQASWKELATSYDTHPNEKANRLVGEALARYVGERGYLAGVVQPPGSPGALRP